MLNYDQHMLNQMPGMFYINDLNQRFMAANDTTADLINYKSAQDIIGLNYFDINCSAVKFANLYVKQDQLVLDQEELIEIIAYADYGDGQNILLYGKKSPFYAPDGKLIGVVGQFHDLTHKNIIHLDSLFSQKQYFNSQTSSGEFFYIIKDSYCDLGLTERLTEVLYFYLKSYSAKEIAAVLHLSPRTIEEYISNLKDHFGCYYRSQLYEKALARGFIHYIPRSLFEKGLI